MLNMGPEQWQLRGEAVVDVTVAGANLQVLVRSDDDECARREQHGPTPRTLSRAQLLALARLPLDMPVPWCEVDFDTGLALDGLPGGVIETDGHLVVRRWRPPVTVASVCSRRRPWSRGLHEVSCFATVAPRLLSVTSPPRDLDHLRTRAERLGVGAYIDQSEPEPLTAPPST